MGRKRKSLRLVVLLNTRRIGLLEKSATGAVYFQYDSAWLADSNATQISHSLPLSEERYSGAPVEAYFENLLPEGTEIRRKIAARIQADSDDPFDLLSIIGRDCVGAVQLLPDGAGEIGAIRKVEGREVDAAEIESILEGLASAPLGASKDFRISIAGVQAKIAFLRHANKWQVPKGLTPTTHIFKKPMGVLQNGIDMSESVENEWLCLEICGKLGLEVANAEMGTFGITKCLVVERFDRQWSKDRKHLYRVPVEDLCQAFGLPSNKKYEADGGPGIPGILKFLESSNEREADREAFLRAQIVFQLLGAANGHAKNYSVFLGPRGMRLTPIYDALSVHPALARRQIEIKDVKLAMAVGSSRKHQMKTILRRHWEETGKASAMRPGKASDLIDKVLRAAENIDASIKLPKGFPPRVSEPIFEGILKTVRQLR